MLGGRQEIVEVVDRRGPQGRASLQPEDARHGVGHRLELDRRVDVDVEQQEPQVGQVGLDLGGAAAIRSKTSVSERQAGRPR